MHQQRRVGILSALLLAMVLPSSDSFRAVQAQSHTITVQIDKPGAEVNPGQFGVFFEDINFGADGGLYAERVKNRSFEFTDPLMGWIKIQPANAQASIGVFEERPLNANTPHYLRIKASGPGAGVSNEGFKGIGVGKGSTYLFSLQGRQSGAGKPKLRLAITGPNGQNLGQSMLEGFTEDWKKLTASIRIKDSAEKASLSLTLENGGAVDLDMISLFPEKTWMNRPNGLRADLVQLLKELKPGFVRFPGGCIVEGRVLDTRYQWKKTIGDLSERKLIINRWNDEFKHRPAPDYFQTFGLGFYEYFLLCEDLGAEPLPILNCGMACQFNSKELTPLTALDPYIQDALDLIEFANGSIVTTWGRKRAEMGHPAPFNMKMLGVGNEQWGPEYIERYEPFAKAIKAKYPEIKLVSSAGPGPSGQRFDFLWKNLRSLNADIVDEHYYMAPKWFLDNAGRYDDYPRTGPKIFAGEFAAQSVGVAKPDNRNNWETALAEAAFMTGLERNGDLVTLASYAPLFGHVEAWQWTPNLIWFDNLRSYGTPNYYVQKLFSNHRGQRLLPTSIDGSRQNGQQKLYASALHEKRSGEVILKLVNANSSAVDARINLAGAGKLGKTGKSFTLANQDLKAENSLDSPTWVSPVERSFDVKSPEFAYSLPPYSLTVLRIAAQ